MRITAQDEYGLRILLRIAKDDPGTGMSIPEISTAEGMSFHNTAKFCRILREAHLITSTRGHTGGYKLAKPPSDINLKSLVVALGGSLYYESFCEDHTGMSNSCTNAQNCGTRSFWNILQSSMDVVLNQLSLDDLMGKEESINKQLSKQFLTK